MVSEIDIIKYNSACKGFDEFCFCHSSEWINIISDFYHFKKKIFQFEENGVSLSLIPFLVTYTLKRKKCLNFLPFTHHIDILGKDKNSINILIKYLLENELPNYHKIIFHTDIIHYVTEENLKSKIFIDNSYVKHTLELSPLLEDITNRFSTNAKRNIKKAIKNQIVIKNSSNEQDLKIFYNLHLLTRKKHGTPIQPFSFFKKIKDIILDKGKGIILTAYKDNIPLAAGVFLFDDNSMICEYGASNPKLLFHRPNELLFYEAIKIAKEKNLKTLDFGISKINNKGLRHFKSGFGATEIPISYSIISNKTIRTKGKTGDNKWLRFVIKHSPLWINRLIGELFYKYAA